MPRIRIHQISTTALDDPNAMFNQMRTFIDSLGQQLAQQTYVQSRADTKNETGLKKMDLVFRLVSGTLQIGIWDGKRPRFLNGTDLQLLQKHNTNYVGKKTDTTAFNSAATRNTHFPNDGDWGFYKDTAGATFHLIFNDGGTTQAAAM